MAYLPLLAPLGFVLAALIFVLRRPARASFWLRLPEITALFALMVSAGAAMLLAQTGPFTSPLIGGQGVGLSARVDILSVTMMTLVSFVAWVVLRFSRVALDGEARQATLMAWMSLTVGFVILLVTAGNVVQLVMAWAAVGVGLHRMLLFYGDRPAAQRAARKKTVSGLAGAGALVIAAGLLVVGYGTSDIASIAEAARNGVQPPALWVATLFLAIAAIFKSALIPTNAWLTEVMEAPTPVSALLHAGVVNAGGFLLIRFADVLLATPGILAVLALIGGFSALSGAAIALTQPSIKTSLAWSTCAQMGFMVLQCGLALFPLALLHIVAHSLYKAYAFLASGEAVETIAKARRPGPVAIPGLKAVGRAFAISMGIFVLVGLAFGIGDKSPQAIALGAMLIFGVAYLIAQGLAEAAPRALTLRTAVMSFAATVAYFGFQTVFDLASAGVLPPPPQPDGLIWAVLTLTVVSFALAALAQATFPLWAGHPAARGLRVHLMNGLYINALTDRMAGRWSPLKG